jgi:hypothetical protein
MNERINAGSRNVAIIFKVPGCIERWTRIMMFGGSPDEIVECRIYSRRRHLRIASKVPRLIE